MSRHLGAGPGEFHRDCICDLLPAPNWIEKPDGLLPLNFKQHIGGLRRIERSKSSRIDNDVLFQGLKSFCCVLPPNKTIIKKNRQPSPNSKFWGSISGPFSRTYFHLAGHGLSSADVWGLLHLLEPASAQFFPPATRSATPKSLEPSKGISAERIAHCDQTITAVGGINPSKYSMSLVKWSTREKA